MRPILCSDSCSLVYPWTVSDGSAILCLLTILLAAKAVCIDNPSRNTLPCPISTSHCTKCNEGCCVLSSEPDSSFRQTFPHNFNVLIAALQSDLKVAVA